MIVTFENCLLWFTINYWILLSYTCLFIFL